MAQFFIKEVIVLDPPDIHEENYYGPFPSLQVAMDKQPELEGLFYNDEEYCQYEDARQTITIEALQPFDDVNAKRLWKESRMWVPHVGTDDSMGDIEEPGFIYSDQSWVKCIIHDDQIFWYTHIERSEYEDTDLNKIEDILWDNHSISNVLDGTPHNVLKSLAPIAEDSYELLEKQSAVYDKEQEELFAYKVPDMSPENPDVDIIILDEEDKQ